MCELEEHVTENSTVVAAQPVYYLVVGEDREEVLSNLVGEGASNMLNSTKHVANMLQLQTCYNLQLQYKQTLINSTSTFQFRISV